MAELTDYETQVLEMKRAESSIYAGSTELSFPTERQMKACDAVMKAWRVYYDAQKEMFLATLEAKKK